MSWDELLKNKKVILVGPAGYLEGKGHGSFIDSFDLIARIGDAFPKEKDFKDYGSRTDIIMDSHASHYVPDERFVDYPHYMELVKKGAHVRILRNAHPGLTAFKSMTSDMKVSSSAIEEKRLLEIEAMVGNYPTKGMVSILTLADAPLKRLHIMGVTFYKKNEGEKTYADFYWPGFDSIVFGAPHHNWEREESIFRSLVKSDERITTDRA